MTRSGPCTCCRLIPPDVLTKLSTDPKIDRAKRKVFSDTLKLDRQMRRLRSQATQVSRTMRTIRGAPPMAFLPNLPVAPPTVTVFACHNALALPGAVDASPASSADAVVRQVFDQTTALARFYFEAFGRSSVDGAGATLVSSVHYGQDYGNAFWNGSEMAYGDGDGDYFVGFSTGAEVIAHEIAHGVTQHALQLSYDGESGGLNESLSDCFGIMFRQWRKGQTDPGQADWLIGPEVLGPAFINQGKSCVRDLSQPDAAHCVTPQPVRYDASIAGLDPHYASGPPNLAFHTACQAAGGASWLGVGKVWYQALSTLPPSPSLSMKAFANATRSIANQIAAEAGANLPAAVDGGWKAVGL